MVKKFGTLVVVLMVLVSLVLIAVVSAHACENKGIAWRVDADGKSLPCGEKPSTTIYNRLVWWKNVGCKKVDDYTINPGRYTVRACDGDDSCCACAHLPVEPGYFARNYSGGIPFRATTYG